MTVLLVWIVVESFAFQSDTIFLKCNSPLSCPSKGRRAFALSSFGSMFGGLFGGADSSGASASSSSPESSRKQFQSKGPTNEIVAVVDGIKQRRLGGSDIIVSEIGLGTQRWCVVLLSKKCAFIH